METIIAAILLVLFVRCSTPPPPVLSTEEQRISVELTSEKRSDCLHKNCEVKGTATITGDTRQWLDYNARFSAARAGANIVSIIYQHDASWDIIMFLCKHCNGAISETCLKL